MNQSYARVFKSLKFVFSFVLSFWIIQILKSLLSVNLSFLGIFPRSTTGLIGVVTAPFIHGDFQHLIANTIPFCILSCLLFLFYTNKSYIIFFLLWITAGFITWLIGRPVWHIGASILIYALAFFLFWGGIMSHKFILMLVSLVILFFYGGLIWGIFPGESHISWEGHLSGALSGLIWAYLFRDILKK